MSVGLSSEVRLPIQDSRWANLLRLKHGGPSCSLALSFYLSTFSSGSCCINRETVIANSITFVTHSSHRNERAMQI